LAKTRRKSWKSEGVSLTIKLPYERFRSPTPYRATGERVEVGASENPSALHVIDIINRLAPVLRGTVNTSAVALGVAVSGTTYVTNTSNLVAVNVANPAAPALLGSLPLTGKVWGAAVDATRNLAAVATGTGGLRIVDITTPASMALRGTATWSPSPPDTLPDARGVALYSLTYGYAVSDASS
jgi:hypothetical protein